MVRVAGVGVVGSATGLPRTRRTRWRWNAKRPPPTSKTAIAALGVTYRRYRQLTSTPGDSVCVDLARRLESPIVLHMVKAGLS